MKNILLVVTLAVSFSSCAALTRYKCNREYAAKKGMDDANNGLSSMPGKLDGSSCEGDYSPSSFAKDYDYGFHTKKNEICQLSNAAAAGKTDGELGNSQRPQKAKYQLCQDNRNFAKFESTYEAEFLKAFCSTNRAIKAAEAQAQSWQPSNYEELFSSCGNGKALMRSYQDAYKKKLSENCSLAEASRFGEEEAKANRPLEQGLEKMQKCEATGKGSFTSAFRTAYSSAKFRMDAELKQREAQEQERLRQVRIQEFMSNVATTHFLFANRSMIAKCTVASDKSYVQTEVENRYPDQLTIQGKWRMQYYGQDFQKITEDQTIEAILITPNNKKSFQKMTLPKDAAYCRAEYLGA